MNEEEILKNIKSYMQNNIDKGYHKFIYNDLGSNEKCIDIINAIENLIKENKKLKKQMEKDIEQHMSEDVYNFLYICDKCKSNNEECHGDYCIETIKEYFEKKVGEE